MAHFRVALGLVLISMIACMVQAIPADDYEQDGIKARGAKFGKVTVEEYKEICKARCVHTENCEFWTWYYPSAKPKYAKRCSMYGGEIDQKMTNRHAVTGSLEGVLNTLVDIDDNKVPEVLPPVVEPAPEPEPVNEENCQASGDSIGQAYSGTTAVTKSGKTCQNWDTQSPHKHTRDDSGGYSSYWNKLGESSAEAMNYCRNPDATGGGLWCYTTDSSKRWEYCTVPTCGDCQAPDDSIGQAYSGTTAVTKSGKTCQNWDAQSPHEHTRDDSGGYSSYWNKLGESSADALNYCRNPDATSGGLWCYTTDSSKRWEYCTVPKCDCKASGDSIGQAYSGTTAVTKSGKTCQNWDDQSPHEHTRDDSGGYSSYWNKLGESSADALNYCRNPDATGGGLWCYTTDSSKRWEYCAVPTCA